MLGQWGEKKSYTNVVVLRLEGMQAFLFSCWEVLSGLAALLCGLHMVAFWHKTTLLLVAECQKQKGNQVSLTCVKGGPHSLNRQKSANV